MRRPPSPCWTEAVTPDPDGPVVVLAPDKFKGSLTAAEVAAAVAAGIRRVRPDARIAAVPVADGGDGTVDAALAAGYDEVPATVAGPTGEPVRSRYARRGARAVVELADASGLVRLPGGRPDPLGATSRGAGELVAAALDAGCTRVVLGVGGSASTDGGAGLLRALGARLLDASGREVAEGGAALADVARVDLGPLRERTRGLELVVACDVDNPLTGDQGAATVYGPQKGADPRQVRELDAALAHWADVLSAATGGSARGARDVRDEPGAGAAGGVGFAALAALGATLRPGIDLVLDLVGFRDRLEGAALVVTGEGALDEQTLRGKAPAGVAAAARAAGVPVVAVCGRSSLAPERLAAAGIGAAYALTDLEPDVGVCVRDAARLLADAGERLARDRLDNWKDVAT